MILPCYSIFRRSLFLNLSSKHHLAKMIGNPWDIEGADKNGAIWDEGYS